MKHSSDEDDFSIAAHERCYIIDDVSKWVKSMGKHIGRLAWFEAWVRDSVFYTKIASSTSLRTTSARSVAKIAKPMENFVSSN